MCKRWFTEEQVIGILKEHQAGVSAGDLNSSSPTLIN